MKERVALGMSGGIDSTMGALLLMDMGYEVTGITMSIWDPAIPIKESTKSGCFGPGEADDLEAARKACSQLGIEHHIIKLQQEYKGKVLDYFCSTYLDGKTPNPCIFCNQRMKFGFLPQRAREMGISFDWFATGHYVRKDYDETTRRWQIKKALDLSKDQSYFLAFLAQDQIKSTLFPLGALRKEEIRDFARARGYEYLTTKKESQDFLETDDYSVLFAANTFGPGEIVDESGKQLGTHRGLIHYTIGQRKNLGLSGMPEPYYVTKIDAVQNRVVVGPKELLFQDRLLATDLNWVSISGLDAPLKASAKIRLGHDAAPCLITPRETEGKQSLELVFDEPQLSITPGQAVVLYQDDLLLGGGIIA